MDCDLSLHYTLSLGDDTQDGDEDDEEEYFDPFEVKPSDKKTEMNVNDITKEEQHNPQGNENEREEDKENENEKENEEHIAGDDYKLDANISEDLVVDKEAETEPADKVPEDVVIQDKQPEKLQEAEEDQDANDEEEASDEDEEDLRKEMEASWEKQEKEKNKGMLDLLESIKNKMKHRSESTSRKKTEKLQTIYPKLNPMVLQNRFNADFKIALNGNSKQKQWKKQAKAHRAQTNLANKRKQITHLLKKKMSKKRKREMRKYRKEFGTERDYYTTDKRLIDGAFVPNDEEEEEESKDAMDSDEYVDIELKLLRKEEKGEGGGHVDDDDIEEMGPEQHIAKIVQDGEDEEDMYRAALMARPETISSEIRKFLDIAADEEDEHGKIVRDKGDEEIEREEKVGIVKNLLAEKSEIQFLKQHKQIYDAKRNQIHRQLEHNETEQELELMKRAFIDGEYRRLQNKRKQQDIGVFGEDNEDGQSELKFKSRNFELDRRNEPEYYLSDNEEKNEFCCYNENGLFYDIYTIRMRIMEWNKNHNELLAALDDEEDKHYILMHQKRAQKREAMNNLSNSNVDQDGNAGSVQKLGTNDQNAIRLLQRVRNKKKRKKPKLNKANTFSALDTNFQLFYKRKGLRVDCGLQKSTSQSFLEHREKCAEVIKTNQSLSMSNVPFAATSCSSNVVFQQHNNPQKQNRKRENSSQAEKNNIKRRRVH